MIPAVTEYELEFEDRFEGPALDERRWLPCYLPQWSSRERAAARYRFGDGGLELLIEEDQEPWCPDWDGDLRVSSLQTGVFAGPVGTHIGQQSAFHPSAVVREAQPEQRLYTPHHGRIETRLRALDHPRAMVALWMIGLEDEPERSGEICIVEIFGRDVLGPDRARVGMGVHKFADPALREEFAREELPIDVREPHVYAAEWTPGARGVLRRRRARQDRRPVARLPDAADARRLRVPGGGGRGLPARLPRRLRPRVPAGHHPVRGGKGTVKLVIGIVRPEKANDVLEALYRAEVRGVSLSRVQGHGGELDRVETYRGTRVQMGLSDKVRFEIAVSDPFVEPTIDALCEGARTGDVGDGKIFVVPLDRVVRIRTHETDDDAVTPVGA